MPNFRKVCVLMGGTSNEREISIDTGNNVAKALAALDQFEVAPIVLNSDSLDSLPAGTDACYIALHGGWGENGGVQAALDARGIPYTGPGAKACELAMDKIATKLTLDRCGLPNAHWAALHNTTYPCPAQLPCVVKPPMDGSSVGISKVSEPGQWKAALELAWGVDKAYRERAGLASHPQVLVEDFIPGREMTVGVIGDTALPAVEICAPGGWYGYEEKYNSGETRYVFPEDGFIPEMQRLALAAFNATGCRGISRVDFRVTPEGKIFILEINTSPGMTSHSLIPKAAARCGVDFPELCLNVLKLAAHD